jgi:hypothetical protein
VINTISDQSNATILISGAGQLGSRYLQGLANCQTNLDIYVQDISKQSLKVAKQRWEEVVPPVDQNIVSRRSDQTIQHKVSFISSFAKTPKQIDIAIVATNADVRPQVVKQIAAKCDVQFWLLEKVLAQSEWALDEIESFTKKSTGAWVNTPRRMMVWHQEIREKLRNESPYQITGSGSLWGLACNGIHHLDLVSWWTGEKLVKIDTSKLDSKWIESRRKGFFEIIGKIVSTYSGGTTLSLESIPEAPEFKLLVEGNNNTWSIDESNGVATGQDGVAISGQNEMQSTMTTRLVDNLLTDGDCDLPTLCESTEMHRIYLCALLEHWNQVHDSNVDTLPIT